MDYRHIDKDPIIDLIRTEAQRCGNIESGEFLERLSHDSGVCVSTLRNWFFGDTRRPQHLTVRFVLDALDLKLAVIRRSDGTEVRGPRHASNRPTHSRHMPRHSEGVAGHA